MEGEGAAGTDGELGAGGGEGVLGLGDVAICAWCGQYFTLPRLFHVESMEWGVDSMEW